MVILTFSGGYTAYPCLSRRLHHWRDGRMCRQLLRALTVNEGLFKGNTLTCTHSASACHANTATYFTSSNYGESSAASFFVVVKVYFLFYRGTYICRGRRNLLVIVVCRRPLMSPRNGGITSKPSSANSVAHWPAVHSFSRQVPQDSC